MLAGASGAQSVASIVDLHPQIEKVRKTPNKSLLGLMDLADVAGVDVLAQWNAIAGQLASCQQAACTADERMHHLARAQSSLEQLDEAISREERVPELERSMLSTINAGWLEIVRKARSAEGQAAQLYERIVESPATWTRWMIPQFLSSLRHILALPRLICKASAIVPYLFGRLSRRRRDPCGRQYCLATDLWRR